MYYMAALWGSLKQEKKIEKEEIEKFLNLFYLGLSV